MSVHTGLKRDDPLDLIFRRPHALTLHKVNTEFIDNTLSELSDHLSVIHHAVEDMTEKQRDRHRQRASKNRQKVNFHVGDYVLINANVTTSNSKLYLTWKGPFHIVSSQLGYVFEVADIITHETKTVHGERMKMYADSSLEVTEAIKLQKSFDDESFIIEQILDIKEDHCFIKWLGFTDVENSWEPMQVILNDAPKLLDAFRQAQVVVAESAS